MPLPPFNLTFLYNLDQGPSLLIYFLLFLFYLVFIIIYLLFIINFLLLFLLVLYFIFHPPPHPFNLTFFTI